MTHSDELISKMREASESNDPFRAMMADIYLRRNNVPYMTTVFEAVQEMNAATDRGDNGSIPKDS